MPQDDTQYPVSQGAATADERIPWGDLTDVERPALIREARQTNLPPDYDEADYLETARRRWQLLQPAEQREWRETREAVAEDKAAKRKEAFEAKIEMERRLERVNNPLLIAVAEPDDTEPDPPLSAGGDFIVPGGSVGIVYGLREAGKSMLMVDAACCWATGRPWLGLTDIVNEPVGVMYLQCEGPREQVANRIVAWEQETDEDPWRRLVHSAPAEFDLADPEAADTIIRAAENERCSVLIIDTLDSVRPNGSNMVDSDVGAIFAKTLPQILYHGISVVLVAHSNESDRSLAGLSRQQNHAEWMIHVQERRGGNRVAILDKQKDVPGKPSVDFHIVDSSYLHPATNRPVGVVRVGKKKSDAAPKATESPVVAADGDDAVLAAVKGNPGASKRAIHKLVPGRDAEIDTALQRLVDAGLVRVEVIGQARCHHAV
jgi:hypothetical protein